MASSALSVTVDSWRTTTSHGNRWVGVATHQVVSEDEAEDSADQLEDDKDDNDHCILHTIEREKPLYIASHDNSLPPFVCFITHQSNKYAGQGNSSNDAQQGYKNCNDSTDNTEDSGRCVPAAKRRENVK